MASGREAGEAEATRLLTELGLTVNEARVYLALLRCFDSPTAAEAARYARAFDRDDREATGKRPLLSLMPLWLARRAAERRSRRG